MPKSIDELLVKINNMNEKNKSTFETSNWFKDTLNTKGKQLEMPPHLDKLIDKGNCKPKHRMFIGSEKYDGVYPRCDNEYFYPKSWLNNFNVHPLYDSGEPCPYDRDDINKIKKNGKTMFGTIDNMVGMINDVPSITSYLLDAKVRKRNNSIRAINPLALTKKETDDAVKTYKNNSYIYKYDNILNNLQKGITYADPTNLTYKLLKAIEHGNYNTAIAKAQALKKGKVHSFNTKDLF